MFGHTAFDLASVGYAQSEFFVTGTAHAYAAAAPLSNDGKWTVTESSSAPYTTRIVAGAAATGMTCPLAAASWFRLAGTDAGGRALFPSST